MAWPIYVLPDDLWKQAGEKGCISRSAYRAGLFSFTGKHGGVAKPYSCSFCMGTPANVFSYCGICRSSFRICHEKMVCFHLAAPSSTGKTTLLMLQLPIGGKDYIQRWRLLQMDWKPRLKCITSSTTFRREWEKLSKDAGNWPIC